MRRTKNYPFAPGNVVFGGNPYRVRALAYLRKLIHAAGIRCIDQLSPFDLHDRPHHGLFRESVRHNPL